jgi:hypothetical protein
MPRAPSDLANYQQDRSRDKAAQFELDEGLVCSRERRGSKVEIEAMIAAVKIDRLQYEPMLFQTTAEPFDISAAVNDTTSPPFRLCLKTN